METSLSKLDYSILQQCMHCGMCLPVCPTYDATKRERNSPRGRIALMRGIADGDFEINNDFAEEMSFCLGCLACQTACPAGVDYARLFETARADIEHQDIQNSPVRNFWRTLTMRILFMRPRLLRLVGRALYFYQNTGLEKIIRRAGLTRLIPENLRKLELQTPRICSKFSHDLIAKEEFPEKEIKHEVALLTGCVQDLAFSSINRDTADVLLANNCAVYTPPLQPCCGSLHAHNGEVTLAGILARRMIDLIPPHKYDAIITNAGGCGSHLRHYSTLLADDPQYSDLAQEWDRKVCDIHEWLIQIGPRVPIASPFDRETSVTYHESCHLVHGQKVVSQPRALLNLIPGLHYIELPESSWCCGSAGVYSITQPEQSEKLLKRKIDHIASTRAQVLATSNPGCHLQISQGIRSEGLEITILQPVTLLALAYRREMKIRHQTSLDSL